MELPRDAEDEIDLEVWKMIDGSLDQRIGTGLPPEDVEAAIRPLLREGLKGTEGYRLGAESVPEGIPEIQSGLRILCDAGMMERSQDGKSWWTTPQGNEYIEGLHEGWAEQEAEI